MQKKDYRFNTSFQNPINSSRLKRLHTIDMEMEEETSASAPAYNLRQRPSPINADDVPFLATSKVQTIVPDVEMATEPLPVSVTPQQQKAFTFNREAEHQPPPPRRGRCGSCRRGNRRGHHTRLVVQTRNPRITDHTSFTSVTGSWCRQGNKTTFAAEDEKKISLYDPARVRQNERGSRLEHAQSRPITCSHREPPGNTRKPERKKRKLQPLHLHQTEESFPRHLKLLRRALLHLQETATEARRNVDQIRRLVFDVDVIETSLQHLVQEQVLDTEDED